MFYKTETMTIPEFLHRDRESIELERKLKRKNLLKKVVFVLACLLIAQHAQEVLATTVDNTLSLDKVGMKILGICRKIGYWVCIIMCVLEIIRTLMQGDTKSIYKIIAKYALGFGALYFVPWIFDLIKASFS